MHFHLLQLQENYWLHGRTVCLDGVVWPLHAYVGTRELLLQRLACSPRPQAVPC